MSHRDAAEMLALRSHVLFQLGDDAADATITEARARAVSSGDRAVEGEIEFLAALQAWTLGDMATSRRFFSRLLDSHEVSEPSRPRHESYVYNSSYWRARALDHCGLIDAQGGDYEGQASALAAAFFELDRSGVPDTFIEARMLANFAVLVREIDSPVLSSYLDARAERLAWNEFTRAYEFEVYQAMGWNRAKRGDHLGAFRHLRRSTSVAPSLARQLRALLDKSFLARELGEVFTAQDDLEYALRLAKQVDWEHAEAFDCTVLYELARHIAPSDPTSARRLWDRYVVLKPRISPVELTARGDRRERADECSALAAILLAEGQRSRAISLYLEGFEIWNEIGYTQRAAMLAIELAELTGEQRYVAYVAAEVEKQPASWLARRYAALKVLVTA